MFTKRKAIDVFFPFFIFELEKNLKISRRSSKRKKEKKRDKKEEKIKF